MKNNMNIGILLTDHVLENLQKKHGDQGDFYINLFKNLDPSIEIEIYDVVKGEYPDSEEDCSGYIITGSRLSIYDDESWIKNLEEYIRLLHKKEKKLLVICFGHQLIAQALGGESGDAAEGWTVVVQQYKFVTQFPWVKTNSPSIALIHSHKDQVKVLPRSAKLVAGNKQVPIAMYYIDNHIMSMQGHPEFTSQYALDVASSRKEILGRSLFQLAKKSLLEDTTDNMEVAKWWINFFKQN